MLSCTSHVASTRLLVQNVRAGEQNKHKSITKTPAQLSPITIRTSPPCNHKRMPVSTRSRKRKSDQVISEREAKKGATKNGEFRPQPRRGPSKQQKKTEEQQRIVCGTSGYSYTHWNNGVYYPRGYSTKQWEYYSSDFCAVELNAPFYRWQKPETWLSWRKRAASISGSEHQLFVYAIKAHQYFSHWRQLNVDDTFVAKFEGFVNDCRRLGPHCGPLLLQFPPRFQCTETNLDRLCKFGQLVQSLNGASTENKGDEKHPLLRVALEFRHSSWFEEPKVFQVARQYNLCICLVHLVNKKPAKWADDMQSGFSPRLQDYPLDACTTWGVYVRFHGAQGQYEGSYSDGFLNDFMNHFKIVPPKQLFIFFNNTDSGNPPSAIRDAKYVCQMSS